MNVVRRARDAIWLTKPRYAGAVPIMYAPP
jgi:hypothetical protein